MSAYVRIAGWGKYLPAPIMPNAELEGMVDTSVEWIRARSGIGERRIACPDETTATPWGLGAVGMAPNIAIQATDSDGQQPLD